MSRRDEHPDALLRHLGATYYETLHGDATAFDVAKAVTSVQQEAAHRSEESLPVRPGDHRRRTGRWRVRDVMRTAAVTAGRQTPAREIARLMSEHRVSAMPVVAGQGRVLGVVSEADRLRSRESHHGLRARLSGRSGKPSRKTAAQLMTTPAITIHPSIHPSIQTRPSRARRG